MASFGARCWPRRANRNDSSEAAKVMITAAVFDTKPYDREPLQRASAASEIEWRFLDFRLSRETAPLARGAQAVCVFVNDQLDHPCLEVLAAHHRPVPVKKRAPQRALRPTRVQPHPSPSAPGPSPVT